MLKLEKIAITGGIACGKSSVAQILQTLGAHVVSADEIVHSLLSHDASTISQIQELLGPDVSKDGNLDRKKIGEIVFQNPDTLLALEKILHPKVRQVIRYQYKQVKGKSLFAAEIPLYYEGQPDDFFDAVVVVTAPEEECLKRWKLGKEEYKRRSSRLIPLEEKVKKADFVIDNSGDLPHLKKQVSVLYNQLRKPL
jgi:dephospho-CoA kinase